MMVMTGEEMMNISGQGSSDQTSAENFCNQAKDIAEGNAKKIRDLYNLANTLNAETLKNAADALAGIRHIAWWADKIAKHHETGNLSKVTGSLHKKLVIIKIEAETQYADLVKLYPE